ncbi:MAG: type II toxin-antitoxin system RelE/ParE family toxin [Rhodocyclales bacterium]|nr:type II toxin-antitoxin system RelE/ParE family toxin [Rhodocyclales bacterium]
MALRWLRQALDDLRGIHDYIAAENPVAARQVISHLREQARLLPLHPEIGRPGRLPGTRELVIVRFPYILAYRERGADIEILLVVHTSRLWPDQLPTLR